MEMRFWPVEEEKEVGGRRSGRYTVQENGQDLVIKQNIEEKGG